MDKVSTNFVLGGHILPVQALKRLSRGAIHVILGLPLLIYSVGVASEAGVGSTFAFVGLSTPL